MFPSSLHCSAHLILDQQQLQRAAAGAGQQPAKRWLATTIPTLSCGSGVIERLRHAWQGREPRGGWAPARRAFCATRRVHPRAST